MIATFEGFAGYHDHTYSNAQKACIILWGRTMYRNRDALPSGSWMPPHDFALQLFDIYVEEAYARGPRLQAMTEVFDEGCYPSGIEEAFGIKPPDGWPPRLPFLTAETYDYIMDTACQPAEYDMTLYNYGDFIELGESFVWVSCATPENAHRYTSWGKEHVFLLPEGTPVIDADGLADKDEWIVRWSVLDKHRVERDT